MPPVSHPFNRRALNDEEAIDIAPECIRFFCERYGRLLKPAGDESSKNLVPA